MGALQAEAALLTQQVKLKDLVIAAYIPPQQQAAIMQRSAWDAAQQCWRIAFAESQNGGPQPNRCTATICLDALFTSAWTRVILYQGTL